ncbi:MAG: hypothetical protein GY830_11080 [Bacteroidetes bacterium]|nr:hypothetical protein [Bacteroidota bacterium]
MSYCKSLIVALFFLVSIKCLNNQEGKNMLGQENIKQKYSQKSNIFSFKNIGGAAKVWPTYKKL